MGLALLLLTRWVFAIVSDNQTGFCIIPANQMSFCIIPADQRDCYTTNLHLRATKQRSPHHHCSHSEWATVTQGSFISLLLARGGAATANGIRLSEVLQR